MTLNIMLVDDNLTFLASVKKVLATLSKTQVVAEAHNGTQALEMAARLQPDLMLLDIVMPGMNGLEVARTMQAWPKSPLVLFLSMHDNEAYRTAAATLGALGLVGKTNFVAELLPIVAALATPAPEASS